MLNNIKIITNIFNITSFQLIHVYSLIFKQVNTKVITLPIYHHHYYHITICADFDYPKLTWFDLN